MKKLIQFPERQLVLPVAGLIFLCTVLLTPVRALSQDQSSFLQYLSAPALSAEQSHYANVLINDEYTSAYWYVSIDWHALEWSSMPVKLPDAGVIQVAVYDSREGFGRTRSWFGKYDGGLGDAVFTLHSGMITARLNGLNGTYMIYPLGEGNMHMLLRLNTSAFPNDESVEGYRHMLQQGSKDPETTEFVDPETGLIPESLAGPCKVRVLVAYTDDVDAALADPLGFCQSAIDAVNVAFGNSNVNFDVEMACALETNYNESLNSTIDKTNFRNDGDGVMDEVHDWRTYYDADLCHLIVNNDTNGCGEAWTVSISAYADAFCVTDRNCAIGNNTFAHELGHLYGCRHDPYVDNTNTPYAYGHGYVYLAGTWRTIMAYNDLCVDNSTSCTRISYFSNPSVNFSGNATGVAGANDNESCHEASRTAIAGLESTVTNKSFPAWTHNNDEYGDVIASTSVTNASTYVMNSGSEVTWRADDYHVLKTGFWAKSGSSFQTLFDNCTAIAPRELPVALYQDQPSGLGSAVALPNPFMDELEIVCHMAAAGPLVIEIYSLLGDKVSSVFDGRLDREGSYRFSVDGSQLASGVYTCVLRCRNKITSIRIVKVG